MTKPTQTDYNTLGTVTIAYYQNIDGSYGWRWILQSEVPVLLQFRKLMCKIGIRLFDK